MECYQEIRVLADPEFKEETLMAALFAKLHRALGAYGQGDIGISFPEYAQKPGSVIRLHGSQMALSMLEANRWRAGLNDYCTATAILTTPEITGWRTVSRVQVKSSVARLVRRSLRKGWITEEQAQQRMTNVKDRQCNLPFLQLKSLSTGQSFRLFIRHSDLHATPTQGVFSSYGLSDTATVPWF
ncbi:MAG: type I-F CRISPR-associated endoribonuclease Cas6/Csy4 [Leclercia sp.]